MYVANTRYANLVGCVAVHLLFVTEPPDFSVSVHIDRRPFARRPNIYRGSDGASVPSHHQVGEGAAGTSVPAGLSPRVRPGSPAGGGWGHDGGTRSAADEKANQTRRYNPP